MLVNNLFYKWTCWVWEITSWGSRLQENYWIYPDECVLLFGSYRVWRLFNETVMFYGSKSCMLLDASEQPMELPFITIELVSKELGWFRRVTRIINWDDQFRGIYRNMTQISKEKPPKDHDVLPKNLPGETGARLQVRYIIVREWSQLKRGSLSKHPKFKPQSSNLPCTRYKRSYVHISRVTYEEMM